MVNLANSCVFCWGCYCYAFSVFCFLFVGFFFTSLHFLSSIFSKKHTLTTIISGKCKLNVPFSYLYSHFKVNVN